MPSFLQAPPAPTPDDGENATPKDTDPEGLKLLETTTPLEQAVKALAPLLELRPEFLDTWIASYDVSVRRGEPYKLTNDLPILIENTTCDVRKISSIATSAEPGSRN